MKTESKTLQELYSELQHKSIAESAEDAFRAKQVSKRRFSQRLMNAVPLLTVLAFIVAVILSAPHTADFFIRVTPAPVWFGVNIAASAPIVFELFTFVVAALNEQKKGEYKRALNSIFLFSIAINVMGSLVSLQNYFTEHGTSNFFELSFYILAPFSGILVSYLGVVSGKILLQFATGENGLEIESGEGWLGKVKYYALKEAFYNAALKHGATPARSSNYAERMAEQYCEGQVFVDDNGMVHAVSAQALTGDASGYQPAMAILGTKGQHGQVSRVSPQSSNDFGFAGMMQGRAQVLSVTDNQNKMGNVDGSILPRMSKKLLIEWLEENPDSWQAMAQGNTKRERAANLAQALTGDASGYKSVERVFDELGITL
jgi:hypothetical protein